MVMEGSPMPQNNYSTLFYASMWLAKGIATIPCKTRSKVSLVPWKAYQNTLPSMFELESWFGADNINLAVITGWNGLVVIDFDSMDYFKLWQGLYQVKTFMVRTGRGVHVYLFLEEPARTLHFPGIDIKAEGGYVLAPPSIHPSGIQYQVLNDAPIARVHSLAEVLPADLLEDPNNHAGQNYPDLQMVRIQVRARINADPWTVANVDQPDLLSQIKNRISILDLIGGEIEKTGDHWFVARCPFHDDHNPSFWIDTQRGLCGCYAGCNQGGKAMDVVNYWSRLRSISNTRAIYELAGLLR
jgi:hypothetical protein